MRKINWDEPLSEEDIGWLRQTGIMGIEDRIAKHQEQFGVDVPEVEVQDDSATKSAQDPTARTGEQAITGDGPRLVDPTEGGVEQDDYPKWKVPELEAEVAARNALPDTTQVEITGTGAGGSVTKADLVKGLRLWDQMNPEALKD